MHSNAANVGQTAAPQAEDNVNYHFVAFACVDNQVVEFDGGKRSHVVHKASSPATFVEDCAGKKSVQYVWSLKITLYRCD